MNNLFLTPFEISKAISNIGEKKASESIFELLIFGILAGIYIAFGASVATSVLSGGTLDAGVAKFLAGSVFSVGLMLVLILGSELFTGKIFGIYFPIMTFIASGYEHSVANMYFLPAALMAKGEFTSGFFGIFNNLIPVTIGNIIGGLLIVLLHPKIEEKIARLFLKKK